MRIDDAQVEVEAQFDDSEYLVTLFAKLGAVAATAAGALLHIVSKAPAVVGRPGPARPAT